MFSSPNRSSTSIEGSTSLGIVVHQIPISAPIPIQSRIAETEKRISSSSKSDETGGDMAVSERPSSQEVKAEEVQYFVFENL